jgi:hypothetical protein
LLALKEPNLSAEDRQSITVALENHGDIARNQRGIYKEAMKLYFNNLVTVNEADKLKIASVINRIPNFINEIGVEDSTDLSTAVRFLCQDFSGNLLLPSFQMTRPGADYYASKLHLYSFVICDISLNTNYVYVYDQRLAGKDFNAMCSLRLLHHLGERELLKSGLGPVPSQLFMCMDNNVGQNKSQVVFMFFALLSLTAYPEGVTLSFLTSGHSHFIPDRVTGNMKQALKSRNIFSPEELLKTINTVKNVEAKFLDHRVKEVYMYTGWDKLLYAHFTEIPQLSKIGGYTSCFFFHFKNGLLSIQKSLQEEVCYVHQYVTGPTGDCTEADIKKCVTSLQSHLFKNNRTFGDATMDDILYSTEGEKNNSKAPYLSQHPSIVIPLKQRVSFWNKAHSIPLDMQAYYGPRPDGFVVESEIVIDDTALKNDSRKRSIMQPATIKAIKKNEKGHISQLPAKSTLLNFFTKSTNDSVVSNKRKQIKIKDWHEEKKEEIEESSEVNILLHNIHVFIHYNVFTLSTFIKLISLTFL